MKWQAACFFWKTQKLHESCGCNEEKINQCLSIRVKAAIIQLPQVENISFTKGTKFLGSLKHVYWKSQSCVKTNLGHTVSFYEKRSQGSALCKCGLPYLLLLWLGENDLLAWRWYPSYFRKLNIMNIVVMQKNEPVYFSGKCKTATIQISLGEYIAFAIRPQFPCS